MLSAFNDTFESVWQRWDTPNVIISDGAYGIGGFYGDCKDPSGLRDWYKPHVEAWSQASRPFTTLWFWNTEIGWANVHPLLEENGWVYVHSNTWDKGKSHIAGNVNTKTIRHFPVATEVCVQYVRKDAYCFNDALSGNQYMQQWMRSEWQRTGLPFKEANVACGVKNAASRKYLASDHLWYAPPPDVMQKMVAYANENGKESGKPYFVMGDDVITESGWKTIRATFNCPYGVYNVWHEKPVRGLERIKSKDGNYLHPNQKPLSLMETIILASSNEDDIVWDVYGGVMTGALACQRTNRVCYTAEPNKVYFDAGLRRLKSDS